MAQRWTTIHARQPARVSTNFLDSTTDTSITTSTRRCCAGRSLRDSGIHHGRAERRSDSVYDSAEGRPFLLLPVVQRAAHTVPGAGSVVRWVTRQGTGRSLAAIYGMCANLDDNFGRLMAALEKSGLRGQHDRAVPDRQRREYGSVQRWHARPEGQRSRRRFASAVVRAVATSVSATTHCRHSRRTLISIRRYWNCAEQKRRTDRESMASSGPSARRSQRQVEFSTSLHQYHMGDRPQPFPAAVRSDRFRLVHARRSNAWETLRYARRSRRNDRSGGDVYRKKSVNCPTRTRNGGEDAHCRCLPEAAHSGWLCRTKPRGVECQRKLPGRDSSFITGPGFAHDWLTAWENVEGQSRVGYRRGEIRRV